jgi:two-component system LytT family response regulator
MKIKALIVDDEHSGRSSMKILLNKHYYYLFEAIETADSIKEAIRMVKGTVYNICFLDIQLVNHSGFELLPYFSPDTKVVFVTAYSEFAIRAIKEQAFDYLLKPLNPSELKTCIFRYEKEYLNNSNSINYLFIKEQGETIPIPLVDIEYLEADGAYSIIFLTKGKSYTTSKTLKTITTSLSEDFIRIHKSYIVNKAMIKSYKKDSLTTIHNKCLPVSRVGAKELSQHF